MDANIVSVKDGVIGVIGEDTDSAFYGVTTLKHVFNQLEEGNELRISELMTMEKLLIGDL